MARAAPDQVLLTTFLCPITPLSTLLSPPSATISHWLWGDSVGCRHWSYRLVCSSVSTPSWEPPEPAPPLLPQGPVHNPALQSHWSTAARGAGGQGRGRSTGTRAAEATRLVWKASGIPFISRMLPCASMTPGIGRRTYLSRSPILPHPSFTIANPESGWTRPKPSSSRSHPASQVLHQHRTKAPGVSTNGCLSTLGFKVFSYPLCHVLLTTTRRGITKPYLTEEETGAQLLVAAPRPEMG